MLIVMTSVPNAGEAESLADGIISSRLAACVQILPQMASVFIWNEKVQKEDEHLLLIKTVHERYDDLEKFIREHHSYDVPEIAAVEAAKVYEGYRRWLSESLS